MCFGNMRFYNLPEQQMVHVIVLRDYHASKPYIRHVVRNGESISYAIRLNCMC